MFYGIWYLCRAIGRRIVVKCVSFVFFWLSLAITMLLRFPHVDHACRLLMYLFCLIHAPHSCVMSFVVIVLQLVRVSDVRVLWISWRLFRVAGS